MAAYIQPQVKLDTVDRLVWDVDHAAARVIVQAVDSAAENVRCFLARRVDWATLIWYLACYNGAYWQRLIWVQRPDLFRSPPVAKRRSMGPAAAIAAPDLGARVKLLVQYKAKLQDMELKMQELSVRSKQLEQEKEKMVDEMRAMESLNQALLIKGEKQQRRSAVQAVRKQLIHALEEVTNGRASIGIKRMGELDPRAFANAYRQTLAEDDDEQLHSEDDKQLDPALICSNWEAEINNSAW
ncbi:hypothetical protein E2562_036216 [Oryza meyeriana var. granulata]|uniref:Factor of DNA methylation 1-5/IDN2 domain-containing protein n=1 Tax=Oryza meyeriana var. granulata TaxID=110450 RepID=A0A6G1ET29_9ORYZ|nr:hypothetical protein E2562_036216 [Oryza meyeriana var. granulata]